MKPAEEKKLDTTKIKYEKGTSLWKDSWKRLKRNKLALFGLFLVSLIVFLAIFADFITPYGPTEQLIWTEGAKAKLAPPSWKHLFGTDLYGRDIFTRVIYGTRISLTIAVAATAISVIVGVFLGACAGYFGGWIDDVISWLINVIYSFPFLLFIIAIVAYLPPSMWLTFVAIGCVSWMRYARLIRGQFLSLREKEFVEAARALGASDFAIMFKHLLPNAIAPIIVDATLGMGSIIMLEAALTYLGFGTQPPTPSWGYMISMGQSYISAGKWWWAVFPGIAICLTVLGFNLLGDGLRDALDPRLKD
ncbi:peptide ABC transporter permease [Anoxybacter fermentans]|uniref:Peptide ABC transporter permease n=1 Tax=Anoxybacter fermentans TaxID=1323375 RepID=A0A3Q9HRB1_9FIRM|nr:ABC transporter permease [Anoxybacter fermentans]AZR73701.1 peptide ABC transporter permease [Anoxybacter fermentans]